jgi:hypothetical protein
VLIGSHTILVHLQVGNPHAEPLSNRRSFQDKRGTIVLSQACLQYLQCLIIAETELDEGAEQRSEASVCSRAKGGTGPANDLGGGQGEFRVCLLVSTPSDAPCRLAIWHSADGELLQPLIGSGIGEA